MHYVLQGIANLTVGAKLAKLLHNATTAITPMLAHKRDQRGKRKRPVAPDQQTGANPAGSLAPSDSPQQSEPDLEGVAELDSILEASMADLKSDDESGGPSPSDPIEGIDEGDVDVLGSALPGNAGRGARAAVLKARKRVQDYSKAVRSWRNLEVLGHPLGSSKMHLMFEVLHVR